MAGMQQIVILNPSTLTASSQPQLMIQAPAAGMGSFMLPGFTSALPNQPAPPFNLQTFPTTSTPYTNQISVPMGTSTPTNQIVTAPLCNTNNISGRGDSLPMALPPGSFMLPGLTTAMPAIQTQQATPMNLQNFPTPSTPYTNQIAVTMATTPANQIVTTPVSNTNNISGRAGSLPIRDEQLGRGLTLPPASNWRTENTATDEPLAIKVEVCEDIEERYTMDCAYEPRSSVDDNTNQAKANHSSSCEFEKCERLKSVYDVNEPYTCGGCERLFTSICLLHEHIGVHGLGGSYHYNNRTRTAFPKYDSVCCMNHTDHTCEILGNRQELTNISDSECVAESEEMDSNETSQGIMPLQVMNSDCSQKTEDNSETNNASFVYVKTEEDNKSGVHNELYEVVDSETDEYFRKRLKLQKNCNDECIAEYTGVKNTEKVTFVKTKKARKIEGAMTDKLPWKRKSERLCTSSGKNRQFNKTPTKRKCNSKQTELCSDQNIEIGSDKEVEIGSDKEFEIGSDKETEIGSDKEVDFGSDKVADIGSDKEAEIGSDKETEIGSDKEVDFGSDKETEIGSDKEVDFGSDKETEIGSDKEVDFGSDKVADIGSDKEVDFGSDKVADIGSDKETDSGSDKVADIGSDEEFEIGSDEETDIDSDKEAEIGSYRKKKRGVKGRRYNGRQLQPKNKNGSPIVSKLGSEFQNCTCFECKLVFESETVLKSHLEKHEGKLECECCSESFPSLTEFEKHVLYGEGKAIKAIDILYCSYCNMMFTEIKGLKAHICVSAEDVKRRRQAIRNGTGTINKKNKELYRVLQYIPRHKGKTSKRTKSKETKNKGTCIKNECEVCSEEFENDYFLTMHKTVHSHPYKCSKCSLYFISEFDRDQHSTSCINPDVHWTCHICGKHFNYKQSFVGHMEIHKTTRDLQCTLCGAVFKTKNSLTTHGKYTCPALEKRRYRFSCDQCGGKFFQKYALNQHMSRVHSDIRTFICEICAAAFKDNDTLRKHRETHREDKKRFMCKTCGVGFTQTISLKRHSKIHLEQCKLKCTYCGKEFHELWNLKAHVRQHTGEKPYKCDSCGQGFTHNVSKKNHMKKCYKTLN